MPHKTSKTHPQKRNFLVGSIQNACFLHPTVASPAAAAAAIDASICPILEGHNNGKWRTVVEAVSWRILQHPRLNLPITNTSPYCTRLQLTGPNSSHRVLVRTD